MPLPGWEVGSGFLTTLTPPPPEVSAQPRFVTVNKAASAASCAASISFENLPMGTSLLGIGIAERNSPPGSLLEQGRSDDQALDLAGSFVDLGDLGVPEVPLGGKIRQVAVAAEDLHGLLGDAVGHLGREQLRHRGFAAVACA